MSTNKMLARRAFIETEGRVFRQYHLSPRARRLGFGEPPLGVRVLEIGSGEPILFLHGLSLCSAHWAPLIAGLGERRWIVIDMPGHGGTDSVDYRHVDLRSWHTTFLTGLLDALGLDSAHIVGHSYGGMFGLWLALDAPARVRSVVSIGTPSIAIGARPDWLFRMLSAPVVGWLTLRSPMPGPVHRATVARALGRTAVKAAPRDLWRATYLATRRSGFAATANRYLHEQFRGQRTDSGGYVLTDDELARIGQPVLFVWGERDNRYQSIEGARRKAGLIPHAEFEVVPGGHEPWLDDSHPCLRAVNDFLASQHHVASRDGKSRP
jgi:pimeloyl-[acyl-carrier protein] methyl ester esterase